MKAHAASILVIVLALLVPIIPFLVFGEQLEALISQRLLDENLSRYPVYVAAAAVILLASDILLPIPSSVVCTVSGKVLGTTLGTMVCWVGLNLSALIGYVSAYVLGWSFVKRLSDKKTLDEVQARVNTWGILPLVIFRPIPVLAEAVVLVMGVYRLPAKLFWPPVLISNLVVAWAFVFLGKLASDQGWFWLALPVSIVVPIALLLMWLMVRPNESARSR